MNAKAEEFDPFHAQTVTNPSERYFADNNVWGIYKASLLLAHQEERSRLVAVVRKAARETSNPQVAVLLLQVAHDIEYTT
jgi:hypothetical protein